MTRPTLFTTAEMEREWAMQDVIEAYKEELNWEDNNVKSSELFDLIDPSKRHVKNANLRNFHAMYPVTLTGP